MSHAGVATELSMDEILEKIQRTIAADGKEVDPKLWTAGQAAVIRGIAYDGPEKAG